MKFGICISVRETAGMKQIPCDYIEESVQRFLAPEQPEDYFIEQLRQARTLSVPIEAANVFLPADMVLLETITQKVDKARLQHYVQTALRRAELAGIKVIVFGSGRARTSPPDIEKSAALQQVQEHLATWSRWAREHGVEIALEPLRYAETNTINTLADGGELITPIADSGARLLADIYHMTSNGEVPSALAPWTGLLAHVHVAEKEQRTAPGRHGDDFRPYLRVLKRNGYNQRISIECTWSNFIEEAAPAIELLRTQWEESD